MEYLICLICILGFLGVIVGVLLVSASMLASIRDKEQYKLLH